MFLYEPDEDGNQHLLGDILYDHGKIVDCEKYWYINGTLLSTRDYLDNDCVYCEYYPLQVNKNY
jgi:hypothetical protein